MTTEQRAIGLGESVQPGAGADLDNPTQEAAIKNGGGQKRSAPIVNTNAIAVCYLVLSGILGVNTQGCAAIDFRASTYPTVVQL